jgi:hypothetical protein
MSIELYQEVVPTQAVPEYELHAGDVVTVVDFVRHPHGGEDGWIVEVFTAVGETIAVLTVPRSFIVPLNADSILTIRPLTQAA